MVNGVRQLAGPGHAVNVSNFPSTDGHRLGLRISSTGGTVSLHIASTPSGPVVFDLPAFVNNIAGTSTGQVNEAVEIAAGTRSVTVRLRHLSLTLAATSLRVVPASAVHVGAGGSATVTATFADSGPGTVSDLQPAVQTPSGWRVTPLGSPAAASVGAGTTVTGRWRLTAPQGGSRTDTAALTALASYTDATTGQHEQTTAQELGLPGISHLSPKSAAGQIVTVEGSDFG